MRVGVYRQAYLHFFLLIEHWDVNTGVFPFVPHPETACPPLFPAVSRE
jgi:hypothetical protein